jgi:hypothetical protein
MQETHLQVIDFNACLLLADGSLRFAKVLLDTFMEYLPECQKKIDQAFLSNDKDKILSAIDDIHSNICHYNVMPRLQSCLDGIETLFGQAEGKTTESLSFYCHHRLMKELKDIKRAYTILIS